MYKNVLAIVIIILFKIVIFDNSCDASSRLALLIGNQGYADAVGPLENPHNDIELLRDALTQIGFEVLPLVKDANRREMRRAVYEFADRLDAAGSDATGFFYYSGHGIAETEEGANYLIPVNVQRLTPSALRLDALRLTEVTDILTEEAPRAAHFVFFDACRNKLRGTRGSKGFIPVAERQGMVIAFASAPGQTASDGDDDGGPYARELARELVRPAQDHYTTLFNVRETLADDPDVTQFPWWRDGLRKRVYFAGEVAASELESDYERAEPIGTKEAWQAFLARHGDQTDSFYVQLARAALQKLAVGTFPEQPQPTPDSERCDGVEVDLASGGTQCIKPGSGESFRDADFVPELVVVPAGGFMMGSLESEEGRNDDEGPQHEVTIPQPFAVGRYAVTFEEWDAAQGDADWQRVTGLEPRTPDDEGWGRGKRPVINVSWNDSRAYAKWLSEETGKTYRLLSEAEWEYAARAGTTGPFSFDGPITTDKANYDGDYSYAGSPKGEDRGRTVPVDSFQPNPWGLYQVHGNVWEWVEDCWNDSYSDKPDSLKVSGSAWTAGNCDYRLLRGGSWGLNPQLLRSASRVWNFRVYRGNYIGFRLARTLTPAAKSASACRELADTLSARVEVREGDQFCDAARQHTARVERIGDQSIRFVVDGGKKFTCREGELCGFDWSPGPTFRVTARADRARGIEPQGALLPR